MPSTSCGPAAPARASPTARASPPAASRPAEAGTPEPALAHAHRLLFVGRRAADPLVAALDGYLARLQRLAPATLLRVRPAGPTREGQAMLAMLGPDEALVALDSGGAQLTSEGLAQLIAGRGRGQGGMAWAVGGADGLAASLLRRATTLWSLGPLTLPHRLAQVIVAEQLYRAENILAGGGYHHGGVAARASGAARRRREGVRSGR